MLPRILGWVVVLATAVVAAVLLWPQAFGLQNQWVAAHVVALQVGHQRTPRAVDGQLRAQCQVALEPAARGMHDDEPRRHDEHGERRQQHGQKPQGVFHEAARRSRAACASGCERVSTRTGASMTSVRVG